MATQTNNASGWVGWVYFAGFLMLARAVIQGIFGFTALMKSNFYLVTKDHLIVANYTAWGWTHLVLGLVLLTAGISVLNGGTWGRIIGVIVTTISLVVNLLFIPAYPLWSIAALVVDVLILYALLVHGAEAKTD